MRNISVLSALIVSALFCTTRAEDAYQRDDFTDFQPAVTTDRPESAAAVTDARQASSARTFQGNVTADKLKYAIYSENTDYNATLLGWVDSNDYTPHIVIPDYVSYNGINVPVRTVNHSAFINGRGITGVTIGSNVVTIGPNAFNSCSITRLSIPSNVQLIMTQAFQSNPLTEVVFENASSTQNPLIIGPSVFAGTKLTTFEIPARLNLFVDGSFARSSDNFLSDNPQLSEITINPAFSSVSRNYSLVVINNALCATREADATDPHYTRVIAYPAAAPSSDFVLETSGVIDVFSEAFYGANLNTVTLTSTLAPREGKVNMIIDDFAFSGSRISALNLNAQGPIRLLSDFALYCYNLKNYALSDAITNYKVFDGVIYARKDGERYLVSYPCGKEGTAFTLPDDVLHISVNGFACNRNLEEVTLPRNLISIGNGAFAGCINLKKINYDGVALADVGASAFASTKFVDEAPAGEVLLGTWLVGYSGAVPSNLTLSPSVSNAIPFVFNNSTEVESVIFPHDFRNIPDGMFWNCTGLKNIQWPENLETIGANAFSYAGQNIETVSMDQLTIPEGVRSVGGSAFAYSRLFKSLSLPSTLEYVEQQAFYTDNTLSRVSINRSTAPNGVNGDVTVIFSKFTLRNGLLVIPTDAVPATFTQSPGWEFSNVECASLGGISDVTAESASLVVDGNNISSADSSLFDLYRADGISLGHAASFGNLSSGVYIAIVGGQAVKIAL